MFNAVEVFFVYFHYNKVHSLTSVKSERSHFYCVLCCTFSPPCTSLFYFYPVSFKVMLWWEWFDTIWWTNLKEMHCNSW